MFGKGRGRLAGAEPPSGVDELKIALDNRAFEIQLFWQRSNYFLVLMTALGIGTFTVKDVLFSPVIATFASIASYFWFQTNLGSKFWQESWEAEVTQLAHEKGVRSFEKSMADIVAQVRQSLDVGNQLHKSSWFHRWIDSQVLKKPSVTHNMIVLSLTSTVVWMAVALFLYWKGLEHMCEKYVCVIRIG